MLFFRAEIFCLVWLRLNVLTFSDPEYIYLTKQTGYDLQSGTSVLIFNKWAGYDLWSGTSVPNILLVTLLTQNSSVLNALNEWETLNSGTRTKISLF